MMGRCFSGGPAKRSGGETRRSQPRQRQGGVKPGLIPRTDLRRLSNFSGYEMSDPKWKRFEKLAVEIQSTLTPHAAVKHNDRIRGRISDVMRQVDISIRYKSGSENILYVIECKDLNRPLDIKDVEEVAGLIKDVGANKASIVSAQGFSAAAKRIAENAGIEPLRLADIGDHDWKARVTVPAFLEYRYISSYEFVFRAHESCDIPEDPHTVEILNRETSNRYLLKHLLFNRWNQRGLPTESGRHVEFPFLEQAVWVERDGGHRPLNIRATIEVERQLFWGHLGLSTKGFYSELTHQLHSSGFRTASVSLEFVRRNWTKVESLDQLAITPVIGFQALQSY